MMNAEKSQHLLKQYASSGDLRVLEQLYMSYQPYVYRQCMSILKHPQESEDACEDIFLVLHDKLKTHVVENFSAWLFSVVRNHCIKRLRRNSQLLFVELKNSDEKSEIDENSDQLDELINCLPEALELLKDDQRWCLILFYLQGKSYKEIENLNGYSFNKIKSSIQHGKKNLRRILSKNEP
jgi:RNA polymerase sigma-70 factor (ECF subfamily)